jgi:hypothetical protein
MPVSYQAALLLAMKIEYHLPPFFAIATRAVDFFVFHSIQALYMNIHLLSNFDLRFLFWRDWKDSNLRPIG